GSWVDARIDRAIPDRKPFPRADIRQMLVPLGPVAIFGASNFPLAFSVAGGDTASALAAGCPVVVKGHPAHPATSELVARAILTAAEKTGMPEGVFSMVQGSGHQVGQRLVQHPLIQAVGFTGSQQGGKALFDLANQRPVPIPVYAEMGSTNPVFVLPRAQAAFESLAKSLAASVTLGVGQFCTNPGLVFLPESEHRESFGAALRNAISDSQAGTMLTAGIKAAFEQGTTELANQTELLAKGTKADTTNAVEGQIYQTTLATFLNNPTLAEEVFGPSSILVMANETEALLEAARKLEGHLTATIHGTEDDLYEYQELVDILERKVGRLVFNGFPTGVEVCDAMVHGGPYPATTASASTSVGTLAIKRFARPVCYQDMPESFLPPALQDPNPLRIWRLVNGHMQL
ncbi:MAG: aldehyde dehydrogenase (NADP(+)), partial [Bacteroidota bacterium]